MVCSKAFVDFDGESAIFDWLEKVSYGLLLNDIVIDVPVLLKRCNKLFNIGPEVILL